jgi:hypothetical protein
MAADSAPGLAAEQELAMAAAAAVHIYTTIATPCTSPTSLPHDTLGQALDSPHTVAAPCTSWGACMLQVVPA